MYRGILALVLIGAAVTSAAAPRRRAAMAEFQRQNPCPVTNSARGRCPGFVIDYVVPLCAGGTDVPANMQWQAVLEARAKDRAELAQCRARRSERNLIYDSSTLGWD